MSGVYTSTTTSTIATVTVGLAMPKPRRTDAELVDIALRAAQLSYWNIRIQRPRYGSNPAFRRYTSGWPSMCVVDFTDKEYQAMRKFAKSFGSTNVHLGRRVNGETDTNLVMGQYEDSSCWYQFADSSDYFAFQRFLDALPKRDRVMKIQQLGSEAKKLLRHASSMVIEGSEGTFLFYHSGAISQTDETLIALACGATPITNRSSKLFP